MGEPASDVGEDDVTQNNMSSTPPKTNIGPKNEGLKNDSSFQQGDFQVPFFFRGCISRLWSWESESLTFLATWLSDYEKPLSRATIWEKF